MTKRDTLVMKFGGTSVGTALAMKQVVSIISNEKGNWENIVVVTSALKGVTDKLLTMASLQSVAHQKRLESLAAELLLQHNELTNDLIQEIDERKRINGVIHQVIDQVVSLCQAISVLGESTPRVLDLIASAGERMSVLILAAALKTGGISAVAVEATNLIVTDDHFNDAHPILPKTINKTREIISPILENGQVPVITGFIAATETGTTTTLGRGGSDFSAALISAALEAKELWIFTDVDGVMTADPRVVPDATTVPICSYREISELAYFGAQVLHPKTIGPIKDSRIGVRVCNTFNPAHPGTRLVSKVDGVDGVIKAITTIRGLQLVTLEGGGMLSVSGAAFRAHKTINRLGINVPLITQASSEQSMCFAIPSTSVKRAVESLMIEFSYEFENGDIERVWTSEAIGIVSVVGEGMRSTPGVAGRIFTALGESNVNIMACAQGSSEVSISMVVTADSVQKTLQILHNLIPKPEFKVQPGTLKELEV
jgi:bifunctional aspartokinase / homoserine dehydrogenase 1